MIRLVVDRLVVKFPNVTREEIEPLARDEFLTLAGRPVKNYLSVLTERSVSRHLTMQATREAEPDTRAAGAASAGDPSPAPQVRLGRAESRA